MNLVSGIDAVRAYDCLGGRRGAGSRDRRAPQKKPGGAAPFDPATSISLREWRGGTGGAARAFSNVGGTTPATNGGPVAAWQDLVASALATTSSATPLLDTNAIQFQGTGHLATPAINLTPFAGAPFEIHITLILASTATQYLYDFGQIAGAGAEGIECVCNAGMISFLSIIGTVVQSCSLTTILTTGVLHQLRLVCDQSKNTGLRLSCYLDGVLNTTAGTSTAQTASLGTDTWTLGAGGTSTSPLSADVRDVRICRGLTVGEAAQVTAFDLALAA